MCKTDSNMCVYHRYAQLSYQDLLEPSPDTLQLLWCMFRNPKICPTALQMEARYRFDVLIHDNPHTSPVPHTYESIMAVWRGYDHVRQVQILYMFHCYAETHRYFKMPKETKRNKGGKGYGLAKAIERATKLKEEGNEAFRTGIWHLAVNRYMEALKAMCPFSPDLCIMRFPQIRESGLSQLQHALACNIARSLIKIASSYISLSDDFVSATTFFLTSMADHPAATRGEISKICQLHLALLKAYPKFSSYNARQFITMTAEMNEKRTVGDDDWVFKNCCARLHELAQEALD